MVRPIRGKSKNTLLAISDSYLQYRTFALTGLTGRNTLITHPKRRSQGRLPLGYGLVAPFGALTQPFTIFRRLLSVDRCLLTIVR